MLRAFSLAVSLITPAAATETYNFIIHGDWGSSLQNQTKVAQQMGIYGEVIDAEFVMALGDNFYDNGVVDTADTLWQTAFHQVYTHRSLQVPWYPIFGNHDYHVDVQGQIDRTFTAGEDLWTFPANYYQVNYKLNDGGRLAVLYIDTQLLDPNQPDTSIILEDPDWESKQNAHLQWIDDSLHAARQSATWVIVAGHYPIYSVGVNCDSSVLTAMLQPLLEKHEVHMYISAHDHNSQFTRMPDGVVYVVSGQSGGRGPFGPEGVRCMGQSASSPYIESYFSECAFAYAEVDSTQLSISFVNVDGKKRFTGVLSNPFEHSIVDEIVDTVNDNVFNGERRHAVQIALEVLAPAIMLSTLAAFFVSFRHFFGCVRADSSSQPSRSLLRMDSSTRSTAGLMDQSTRSHFLDDGSDEGQPVARV